MKQVLVFIFALLLTGCANAQSVSIHKLDLTGCSLPPIRHITDMKISGDTLLFVYETEDGFGQRFLRRAIIEPKCNALDISTDIGKIDGGYYASYMPYPFFDNARNIRVISQDVCEFFTVENDTALVRTKRYLMDGGSTVPFPLSQYVQDVYIKNPDRYVFIGREPKGGRQYAMTADLGTSKVDTIRQINISPELQAWMPNAGEMAYSGKYNRLAFAYKLHPVVEIFNTDGGTIKSVKIGDETFNPKTLEEADFDDLNILHTVDVTCTPDYIYALYWGFKYADSQKSMPAIIKLDWDGNIIARYSDLAYPLYRIATKDDSTIVGWTGKEFVSMSL